MPPKKPRAPRQRSLDELGKADPSVRALVRQAFEEPEADGFQQFNRLCALIMTEVMAGRLTPEQAGACRDMAELLLTSVTARELSKAKTRAPILPAAANHLAKPLAPPPEDELQVTVLGPDGEPLLHV